MTLVYVHGIGNRPGRRYEAAARRREALFRTVLLPAAGLEGSSITMPNWGGLTRAPRWGLASLPHKVTESLGPDADDRDALVEEAPSLLIVARQSVTDALDALYTLLEPRAEDEDLLTRQAPVIVQYICRHESLHPGVPEHVRYPWLNEVHDDIEFVDRLVAEVWPPEGETLGAGSRIRDLFVSAARRFNPAAVVVGASRRLVSTSTAQLLADVLQYPALRGTRERPGEVVSLLAEAIEGAAAPRVVLAHSMGGNIVYDVLSHYRPDLVVDVFVTIGSQVGLFEELGLFQESRPDDDAERVPLPHNVRNWINVVDPADPLSFRVAPVFAGADDYTYPSRAVWAHTAYLKQPTFHHRVGSRIAEALT
ncbi:hypothetical protein [Lentzea sp. HUAS12]|uniref:hypothetical protein n=1 Tax=Lentzea sp. HUAS12 TaxID=2951806 RepID=UPI00209EA66D|nr:hypothetical protein [Lentzea sp. HUAS12]USX55024.1 hypothetical protein ND450_13255 [Lentzea sp. HUAS12]